MGKQHKEKIDLLIKFLKREPKEEDMVPVIKGILLFETKDSYKKYSMLDKHIKLVAKCIAEGIVTSDYFFNSFNRIIVLNYGEYCEIDLGFLFPNSNDLKMMYCLNSKLCEVGCSFFKKFDVINVHGIKYTIEEPRDRSVFDLVEN